MSRLFRTQNAKIFKSSELILYSMMSCRSLIFRRHTMFEDVTEFISINFDEMTSFIFFFLVFCLPGWESLGF